MFKRLILSLLPLLFGLLTYVETRGGGYIETTDGAAYWHASRTLLEGRGFRNFSADDPLADKLWAIGAPDAPLATWTPLTAVLLTAFADKQTGNAVINAIALMVVMVAAGALVQGETRRMAIALAVQAAIGTYAYNTEVYRADLSEPAFTALLMLTICFARHLRHPAAFVAGAFTLALLPMTRYAALPLLPAFGGWALLHRRRWMDGVMFLLPVGAILLCWLVRNLLLTGTWFGVRPPPDATLLDVITSLWTTVLSWQGGVLLVLCVGCLTVAWPSSRSRWRRPTPYSRHARL